MISVVVGIILMRDEIDFRLATATPTDPLTAKYNGNNVPIHENDNRSVKINNSNYNFMHRSYLTYYIISQFGS